MFRAHGFQVKSEEELKSLTSDRENQKYVIKPIDGSGARGVLLIDGNTDLSWAYKESKKDGAYLKKS